jgi:hypothetical protein
VSHEAVDPADLASEPGGKPRSSGTSALHLCEEIRQNKENVPDLEVCPRGQGFVYDAAEEVTHTGEVVQLEL